MFAFVSILGAGSAVGTVPTSEQVQVITTKCAAELGGQIIVRDATGKGIDVTVVKCGATTCPTGFAPYVCVQPVSQATADPPPPSANAKCLSCKCLHVSFELIPI